MNNDLLFTAAIHGDEKIGVNVLQSLKKKGILFDWLLANEKAYENNSRFIDVDLNRTFPGNEKSEKYEEKIAAKIYDQAKNYDYLVDIHGADSPTGIFIILSNPNKENLLFSSLFDIENIVLWPSKSKTGTGALNGCVKCGLEIESGSKDRKSTEIQLIEILVKFLKNFKQPNTIDRLEKLKEKKYFIVDGKLEKSEDGQIIKSFQPFLYQGQTFFPLLEDQYEGFKCYKMKEISFTEICENFFLDK